MEIVTEPYSLTAAFHVQQQIFFKANEVTAASELFPISPKTKLVIETNRL